MQWHKQSWSVHVPYTELGACSRFHGGVKVTRTADASMHLHLLVLCLIVALILVMLEPDDDALVIC